MLARILVVFTFVSVSMCVAGETVHADLQPVAPGTSTSIIVTRSCPAGDNIVVGLWPTSGGDVSSGMWSGAIDVGSLEVDLATSSGGAPLLAAFQYLVTERCSSAQEQNCHVVTTTTTTATEPVAIESASPTTCPLFGPSPGTATTAPPPSSLPETGPGSSTHTAMAALAVSLVGVILIAIARRRSQPAA